MIHLVNFEKGASAPFSLEINAPRLRDNFLLQRGLVALQNGDFADALIDCESVCRRQRRSSLPAVLRAKVLQLAQPTKVAKAWYAAWCRDPQDADIQDAMLMAFLDAGAKSVVQELGVLFLPDRCKAGNHESLFQCLQQAGSSVIAACWKRGETVEGMVLDTTCATGNPCTGQLLLCSGDNEKVVEVPFDGSWFAVPRPESADVWTVARPSFNGSGAYVPVAGSPLVFGSISAVSPTVRPKEKTGRHGKSVSIIVPVYGGAALARACIDSVLASQRHNVTPTLLTVVDDASPDANLVQWLDDLAGSGRITLLRNRFNLGFIETCNLGLRSAGGSDPLLLNADTLVHGDWVDRLQAALYSADDIASVTPWSNNGEVSSFPKIARCAPVPDLVQLSQIDSAAATLRNSGRTADVALPTCCGFAMLMRESAIQRIGLLDGAGLVRGYNEEVDWCLRAASVGMRHLLATGVFVAHAGTASFGYEKTLRVAQNRAVVTARYPDFYPQYQTFLQQDGLKPERQLLRSALESTCADWLDAATSATNGIVKLASLLPDALPASCSRIAVFVPGMDSWVGQQVLALARLIAGLPNTELKLRLLLLGHATEALWHTGVVDVLPEVVDAESQLLGDSALLGLSGCLVLLTDASVDRAPAGVEHVRMGADFVASTWLYSWLECGVPLV